ncbi:HAD family phosphatase [Vibrio sp. SM6]|uniref:HAD family phosphatase n=1 Tax=Vibrio agarilyticus TaxID=2726741 RepID=A0A7X8YFM5_9VIBR|nr:HAD family phosphatase [Vibrio agarilyticus]NLS11695.1 HAD family phosphatase [Vibrio agarilyticus]
MKFYGAIFDMDGLLLDTERVCMRVFEQACITTNNPFNRDIYLSIIGRNAVGIERIFRELYGDNYDKLHQEWRTHYTALVTEQAIPKKTGVIELLDWLKAQGIKLAVATSSQRDVSLRKLTLAGLIGYFDHVTTGCEVSQGKPDPEIYLLAAKRLGLKPQQCLAFEDSNNGVLAAVSAEMTTYQVPDLVEPNSEILALGHTVLPSLNDVLTQLKSF